MMLLELQMDSLFRETLSFQSLSTMRSGFGRSGTIKWVCIVWIMDQEGFVPRAYIEM